MTMATRLSARSCSPSTGGRDDAQSNARASLVALRVPAPGIEFGAVRANRLGPGGGRPTILHRVSGDLQLGTWSEIAPAHLHLHERARPLGLEAPRRHFAVCTGDVHEQPGVGIRVLKFLHDAFERHFLRVVEHRAGVMRARHRRDGEYRGANDGTENGFAHLLCSRVRLSPPVNVKSLYWVLPSGVL